MDSTRRAGVAVGIVLISAGIWFLLLQFLPGLGSWFSWPMIIVGVGGLLFLIGILAGEPGMAVPGCVVGGIGLLLYWQNATGNWASWSYAWSLIPGFVGVGVLISGVFTGNREELRGGAWLMAISLVLFAVFSSVFGITGFLGKYWPVLVIGLGAVLLIQALFRRD